jgi:serine protease Do
MIARSSAILAFVLVISLAPGPVCAAPAEQARAGLAELSRSLQQLADKVSPAVVQIFVTGHGVRDDEDPAAKGEPVLERSSGSGVIVDGDGYIVTNAHVIENATRLEVELPLAATGGAPGRSIIKRRGRIVGAQIVSVDRETDIAVIKVDARGLPALPFGDSDALRPGQLVLAFGSPLGLESSVTMGVVSAVARQLTPEDPMIYLQTDAPINPGNSGGALVDVEGRLVGVNTLIYSQSGGNEGIGFAAPSNIVRNVFQQIRTYGRVRRGEIGVVAQTVTPVIAEGLGLAGDAGVILSDVAAGSPAAQAGLQPGDVVLSLNGKPMENGRQFRINVYTHGVGEQIAIQVQRAGRMLTMKVPVVEREDHAARLAALVAGKQTVEGLGFVGIDLTPAIAELLPSLRRKSGVVVVRPTAEAPYSQQGVLESGDVIHSLNGRDVTNLETLKTVLAAVKIGAALVLQVERDGSLLYIAFRAQR